MSRYIVTADCHLRMDLPVCRTETQAEWLEFQYQRLVELVDIANTQSADLIIAGDLFDTPRVPAEVVSIFLTAMQPLLGEVFIIAGNHSLNAHREGNVLASSIGIIKSLDSKKIHYCTCVEELIEGRFQHSYKLNDDVTIVHTLVFPTEDDIAFGWNAVTADYLLDRFDTTWIFSGDMHKAFVHKSKDRYVVNPGCMTVQTIGEADYTPSVFFVNTGDKVDVSVRADVDKKVYRTSGVVVKQIPLFHDPSKVSRAHIDAKHEKDAALESALAVFGEMGETISLDFVKNLEEYLIKNKASSGAVDIIEEVKNGKSD